MYRLFINIILSILLRLRFTSILIAAVISIFITSLPVLAIDIDVEYEIEQESDNPVDVTLISSNKNPIDEIKVLITDNKDWRVPVKNSIVEKIGRMKGMLKVNGLQYSGKLDIYKDMQGMYVVNSIPIENYVKSVVMSELLPNWNFEALKVQAVIARTYAINHILNKPNGLYHLTSSTNHQMYNGNDFTAMVSRAVDKTAGEVLTYDGKVIIAYYHSSSVGKTELPDEVFHKEYPYLKSVESDGSLSKMVAWTREIPFTDIETALKIKDIINVSIDSYTKTGRVKTLKISGRNNVIIIEAKDFRKLIGWKVLPSTMFTIEESKKALIVTGSGYGHGVGLSQWGSLKMAKDGENYRKILSHYYPGTTIKLYDDL